MDPTRTKVNLRFYDEYGDWKFDTDILVDLHKLKTMGLEYIIRHKYRNDELIDGRKWKGVISAHCENIGGIVMIVKGEK